MHCFEVQLKKDELNTGRMFIEIPPEFVISTGIKGRIPVSGAIDGCPFRLSLLPGKNARHTLIINQTILKFIGKNTGELVSVEMQHDTLPRSVELPDDLASALAANPETHGVFSRFTYSHQKEITDWLNDTRNPATRQKRIEKAILTFNKQYQGQ